MQLADFKAMFRPPHPLHKTNLPNAFRKQFFLILSLGIPHQSLIGCGQILNTGDNFFHLQKGILRHKRTQNTRKDKEMTEKSYL
jgi:hypothetical protein